MSETQFKGIYYIPIIYQKFDIISLLKYFVLSFLALVERRRGATLSVICKFSNEFAIRSISCISSTSSFASITSLS